MPLTEKYNLNDPLLIQYGKYIWGIFTRGDFGVNFRNRPVLEIVQDAAPITIKLGLTAFVIEIAIGILAGVMAGLRRGGFFDNVVLICTTLIISIPVFVLGVRGPAHDRRQAGLARWGRDLPDLVRARIGPGRGRTSCRR